MEFGKKAYLLRAVNAARKTLDITCYVQSDFPIKRKIDGKTGLVRKFLKISLVKNKSLSYIHRTS